MYVRTYVPLSFQVVCNIDGGDVVKSDSPAPSVVNSNVFTEFVSQLALPDDQKKVYTYLLILVQYVRTPGYLGVTLYVLVSQCEVRSKASLCVYIL